MNTYLLTWNPKNWHWKDFHESLDRFRRQGYLKDRWSTGNTKSMRRDDRFFLIKLAEEPKGIIGSGWIDAFPFEAAHWNGVPGRVALYAPIVFDMLLDPKSKVFPLSTLSKGPFTEVNWTPQASGMLIPSEVAVKLEEAWRSFLGLPNLVNPISYADESPEEIKATEGKKASATFTYYERSAWARSRCIHEYGTNCAVCGIDFGVIYGKIGEGYIHVHHLIPVSARGAEYEIDPVRDLRPVCPNCHAMLHQRNPVYSIEELKAAIHTGSK